MSNGNTVLQYSENCLSAWDVNVLRIHYTLLAGYNITCDFANIALKGTVKRKQEKNITFSDFP